MLPRLSLTFVLTFALSSMATVMVGCGSTPGGNGSPDGGTGTPPNDAGNQPTDGGQNTPDAGGDASTPGGITPAEAIAAIEQNVGGVVAGSLADRMDVYSTPGVSVALIHEGELAWSEGWGIYNSDTQSAMRPDSKLQAGSISKPTTALAILSLVDDGLIGLDAPLNDAMTTWLVPSNMLTEVEPVTLRRVLSHTAGFNVPSFLGYGTSSNIPSIVQILDGESPATNNPIRVVQMPGTDWQYSGGAYTILVQLLEDVTEQSFATWVDANLFQPAGMMDSSFEQPLSDPETLNTPIGSSFGAPGPARVHPELSAAGLWSTAPDLARLVMEIQSAIAGQSTILGDTTARGMIEPQSPSPSVFDLGFSLNPGMGLGLFLADGPDPGWFWHTGGNIGFTCIIVGDTRGDGYGAAVMTNAAPSGRLLAWEIINGLADLYEWPGWENWGI